MATFGQGINPQFGAIDYSPIQRGAAVGAQLAAQGGSMIGQGLANLGQEVGKGMQIYYKKKEENKLMDDSINTLQNLNTKSPELFENIIKDPNDKGAWRALIKTAGGPAQVMQMATAINAGIDERGGQALAAMYSSQGTTEISPEDGTTYSARARQLGRNQFMTDQLTKANLESLQATTELNRAKAKTEGVPVLPPPMPGFRYALDGSGNQEPIPGGDRDPLNPDSSAARENDKAAREEATLVNQTVAAEQALFDKREAAVAKAEDRANTRYKQRVNVDTTKIRVENYIATLKDAYTRVTTDGAGGQIAGTGAVKFIGNLAGGVAGLFGPAAGNYFSSSADLELIYDKIKGQQILETVIGFKLNSPTGGNIFAGSQSDAEGKLLQDAGGSLKTSSNPAMQAKTLKDMIDRAERSLLFPLEAEKRRMQAEDDAMELGNIYNVDFNLRK